MFNQLTTPRRTIWCILACSFAGTALAQLPESRRDLLYTTFQQPCRIIDTRAAGGPIPSGGSRDFKVAGTTGFDLQGGNNGGCAVPTDASAAMINFVAVNPQGGGNLKGSAFPNPIPATGSVINYQALSPNLNIANGLLFPICDRSASSCEFDITLQANGAGTHVVADVMGYARKFQFQCDAGRFDLNTVTADGCEFELDDDAIYVSGTDPGASDDSLCGLGPIGTGAGNHPCLTIFQGLQRAQTPPGRSQVLVADGRYGESVNMVNGKSLLGGYRPDTWERHVDTTNTIIDGFSSILNHDRTVTASGITAPTELEGFVIIGSANTKASGNSYAIYVSSSDADLKIWHNVIRAGRGGPGAPGGAGADGANGVSGVGRASNPAAYDAKIATGAGFCDASNNRGYTNGGLRTCASTDVVNGGNGGGNQCPPANDLTELSGKDGFSGQPGNNGGTGGIGGDAGDDMRLEYSVPTSQPICYIPAQPTYGRNGNNGVRGNDGGLASACSNPAGSVVGGQWVGGSVPLGTPGGNGGGGGGGGAGGGAYCMGCTDGKDRLGAHGGGGGAGACGGGAGGPGVSGGGAFGIFVYSGVAPNITNNLIVRGEGGAGGTGGHGGAGGTGGAGGAGGLSAVFCADPAGNGGAGGDGGHGSGGAGGCGGSSFGIYTSGVGSPAYCGGAAGNTVSGGAGGAGGNGGFSLINAGPAGSFGSLNACVSN